MTLGHDINGIDRTKDVQISKDITFETMLLAPNTLEGLRKSGFYRPSPIQLLGIPLGKCGFDLLLEAKSGTGKTAVFSVIALEKLDLNNGLQVIILAPTREIAAQICDVLREIGSFYKELCIEVVMGGLPVQDDIKKFSEKIPHVVVGSPGRLKHLITDKHIDVSAVRLFVLDEADKLMEKSFLVDIKYIHSALPKQKQVIMSSATYPDCSKDFISQFVCNAQHVCPNSNSVLLGVVQKFTNVKYNSNVMKQTQLRFKELAEILSKIPFKQCLIFCNYQARVAELHKMLTKNKWPAEQLHGQQDQSDRLDALKTLQEYKCRILVSTDLASRGIDASNIDLVINFEPPFEWQTYLHRIGRAGRFGSYGTAITILSEGTEHKKYMNMIKSLNAPINLIKLWNDDSSCSEKDSGNVKSEQSKSEENNEITNGKELTFVNSDEEKNNNLLTESFNDLLKSCQEHNINQIPDEKLNLQSKYRDCEFTDQHFKNCIRNNQFDELWQVICPGVENDVTLKTFNDLLESCKTNIDSTVKEDVAYKCLHMPELKIFYKQKFESLNNDSNKSIQQFYSPSTQINGNMCEILHLCEKVNSSALKEEGECNESFKENILNPKAELQNKTCKNNKINRTKSTSTQQISSNNFDDQRKYPSDEDKTYYKNNVIKYECNNLEREFKNVNKEDSNNLWNIDNSDFIKLGLPTAFGSSKNKKREQNHKINEENYKHDHEPIKLWEHKPRRHILDNGISIFEDSNEKNMHKSDQNMSKDYDSDYSSNDYKLTAPQDSKHKVLANNRTHDVLPNETMRDNNPQKASAYQNYHYNKWYRKLKLRMKQIEMIVYMDELNRMNR